MKFEFLGRVRYLIGVRQTHLSQVFKKTVPAVALLIMFGSAGCRTGGAFTPVDLNAPGWIQKSGQAVWHPPNAESDIAGELHFSRHRDDIIIVQFFKPPFSMAQARLEPGRWEASFGADKVYSGRGLPPARMAWLQLALALAHREVVAPWEFSTKAGNRWILENKKTGERISGYLEE